MRWKDFCTTRSCFVAALMVCAIILLLPQIALSDGSGVQSVNEGEKTLIEVLERIAVPLFVGLVASVPSVIGALNMRKARAAGEDTSRSMAQLQTSFAELGPAMRAREMRIEARLHAAFEGILSPIFETDANGSCLWVNSAWSRITGLTLAEALGDGWIAGLDPEHKDRIMSEWKIAAAAKGKFGPTEVYYRNGKATVTAMPIFETDNRVSCYIGVGSFPQYTWESDKAAADAHLEKCPFVAEKKKKTAVKTRKRVSAPKKTPRTRKKV